MTKSIKLNLAGIKPNKPKAEIAKQVSAFNLSQPKTETKAKLQAPKSQAPKPLNLNLNAPKPKSNGIITNAPSKAVIRNAALSIKPGELTLKRPSGAQIERRQNLSPNAIARDNKPVLTLRGSGLVPEGFQFDDSQLQALHSLTRFTHGSLIGAAGTGKTTCTKAFVQHIAHSVESIDADYAERKANEEAGKPHEEYMTPSVLLCAFTGRAVRQIKKNFPQEWHKNIMTIHRALRYMPVMEERLQDDGSTKTIRKFVPTHCATLPMPWEVIIIDESSMVSLDLWDKFQEAMLSKTRVYMVGDLNQLPPVQGRSIFGYALAKWNIAELTHVHRQKGSNDAIVPNAHRILKGQRPENGSNFKMMPIDQYPERAQQQVIAYVKKLHELQQFNPLYDSIITAVNGANWDSPSAPLGQIPLNEPLARYFNSDAPRNVIDAGRSRKIFAIGDKVMATKNDYDSGVTNGMMGIITDIVLNNEYVGDRTMVGNLEKVQSKIDSLNEKIELDANALAEQLSMENAEKKTESFMKGTASHTITVNFTACESEGADDTGEHVISFRTYGEVESLQLAYASTCHKMQGAECPTTIVLCHEVFGQMLNREWLYTACTRASHKLLLLYTEKGLSKALTRQRITGTNVRQKADSFRKLMEQQAQSKFAKKLSVGAMNVKLPEARELDDDANALQ